MNSTRLSSVFYASRRLTRLIFLTATSLLAWNIAAQTPGTMLWKFQTAGEIRSSPALARDGTIYFGSRDGNLYALTPTGNKKWQFTTAGFVDAAPAVGPDGTIFVGSLDKNLYAVSPEGNEVWKFKTGGGIINPVAIGPDRSIYFTSADSTLYAVSSGGAKQWEFAIGSVTFAPTIGKDKAIYVPYVDNQTITLIAFNPDGSRKWQYRGPGLVSSQIIASCILDQEGLIYLYFAPATSGSKSRSYDLAVLSPVDGSVLQTKVAGFDEIPAVGTGDLRYGSDSLLRLSALFPDGTVKWRTDVSGLGFGRMSTSPALSQDGFLYVGTRTSPTFGTPNYYFLAFDGSGKKLWNLEIPGQVDAHPVISTNGTVYFGSRDGNLYAVKGTVGPAASAWPTYRRDAQHTGSAAEIVLPDLLRINMYAGLTINGDVGRSYRIDYTTDLNGITGWSPLATVVLDRTPYLYMDIRSGDSPKRFYRAVAVP